VIGGLIFATVSTLFFVPVVFSIIHRHYGPSRRRKPIPEQPMSQPDRIPAAPFRAGCAWSAAHSCSSPSPSLPTAWAARGAELAPARGDRSAGRADVAVVTPTQVENHSGLDLPGRLEAYIRAPIYARVPGT
jgi:hypothetical protein